MVTGQNGRVIASYGSDTDFGMVVEAPKAIIEWLERQPAVAKVYTQNIPNKIIGTYRNACIVDGARQWNDYVSHGFKKEFLPTATARKTA